MTVLFADMERYTPLAEHLGEERIFDVMQRVIRKMMGAVHENEGTVQDLAGDGLMALFGAPLAIEDAPLKACRAALIMQARMQELASELVAELGVYPKLRVGIHTGPVVMGEIGDDQHLERRALGDTVNVAARLESLADPGSVFVSEATYHMIEGYVAASFCGEREIKGKAKPVGIYRVESLKPGVARFDVAVSRGLTAFIGRQGEVDRLEELWGEVKSDATRLVGIVGEAGIGKSRLVYEFRSGFGEETNIFLQGHCTADGRATPFLPFIEVVRTSFRIAESADNATIKSKLRRGLEVLGLSVDGHLPYLLNLLGQADDEGVTRGMAPEIIGVRTRESIRSLLQARCRLMPTAMVIEDLHWIDSASEAWLEWVASSSDGMPLLVLCTYRPEYRPRWVGKPNATECHLGWLSSSETIELLRRRLNVDKLPQNLTRVVLDKTEGNPLFVEEIVNYLVENGCIRTREREVSYQPKGDASIPMTLANLLMNRVDRLPEGPRKVLQTASVIGRRFSIGLACTVSGVGDAAVEYVRDLQREELIFANRGDEYRFKHALVQDAVYNSLLTPHQEKLHESVAAALELEHANRLPEWADVLAYHYSHTRRVEKAVTYLAMAGYKSLNVYSLEEAEQRFRQALELLENEAAAIDGVEFVDVLLNLSRVYYFRAKIRSIVALGERYLSRVEVVGDGHRLSRFLFETGYAQLLSGRRDTGKASLERALKIAEAGGDDEGIGYACMGLQWNYAFWEPPTKERRDNARRVGERALEIGKRLGDVWLVAKSLGASCSEAGLWGRPDEVLNFEHQLLDLGRETEDTRAKSEAMFRIALSLASRGNYIEAIEHADLSLSLSLSPIDWLFAHNAKGLALVLSGNVRDGLSELAEVRHMMQEGGLVQNGMFVEVPYGAALVSSGNMSNGIRHISDAVERYARMGQPFSRTYGHWILGEIYLRMVLSNTRPPLSVILKNIGFLLRTLPFVARIARHHLEAATRDSRTFNMPGHLARCLCSLGQLHQAKGRVADARTCFEEARPIAEAYESTLLCDKIDSGLEKLNL